MALLQSTTISGSNANTGSLSITGSTMVFPIIESSLTGSFSGSGKMWVNADGQTLQYSVNTTLGTIQSPASFMGAWSTATSAPISGYGEGAGTQDAALWWGIYVPSGNTNCTLEYSGNAWSVGGNMIITRRDSSGGGSQNAAFTAGGYGTGYTQATEEYNGSSWASGGNLITLATSPKGGSQQAGIAAAGLTPGGSNSLATEFYNGASWASGPNTNDCHTNGSGILGTQNAGIVGGGRTPTQTTCTEEFNGTSWFSQNPFNTLRSQIAGFGDTNATVFAGGHLAPNTNLKATEEWNGISWVNACDLPSADFRDSSNNIGSSTAGMIVGSSVPYNGTNLEYNKDFIVPYTTCVWSNGSGMIFPRSQGAAGGTKNASFVAGGGTPGRVACTEEWDGNQWSVGGVLSTARSALAGGGTLNAGWVAGGEPAGGTSTEEYNGTSWAGGGSLASGGYGKRGGGPQTSAQVVNGTPSRDGNQTYDGTTWTAATAMPTQRGASALTGTCAASIVYGGSDAPGTYLNYGITWNGSAWSQTGATNTCARGNQMGGTQNDALSFGGYNPAEPVAIFSTEHYDGSVWSVQGNLSVASKYGAGAATSPAGAVDSFLAGGYFAPAMVGNMQLFGSVCSSTLCSNLPVWSGVAPMLAHSGYSAVFGTQNAAVVTTGKDASGTTTYGTEEYNGTSWSPGGTNVNQTGEATGRFAAGTLNAGLLMGGWPTQTWTEEYDGTTWTAANAMSICRNSGGGNGTQTAALVAGGIMTYPSKTDATEEYDGTNWSSGGALSTARYLNLSTGTQNDAVTTGGQPGSTSTEEYNGSTWATGGSLPGGKGDTTGAMMGVGAYDATFAAGYTPTRLSDNFQYDGASWSVRPQYPLAVNAAGRIGTSNAGLMTGGRTNSGYITNVFAYDNNINTCVGAWSAGPNTVVTGNREVGFGAVGTQNAAALFSGRIAPANITCTEEYNGSSWSAGGANITARYVGSNTGTQNAGLLVGGNNAAATCLACVEEYNGSTWASNTANPRGVDFLTSLGTQNAAVSFGGRDQGGAPASGFVCTQFYDGTSWTAKNSLSTGRYGSGGIGTQNSALAIGGYCASVPAGYNVSCATVEEWDGTNWSSAQNLLIGVGAGNTAGTTNDTLMIGGAAPGYTVASYNQSWDGTAWSLPQNLLAIAARLGSGGSGNAAIAAKGYSGMGTALWNVNPLGAGSQNWIGKVDFVTE